MTRRYNLRKRKGDVEWVKDDTMDESETTDSDYEPSEEEEEITSESESESDETPVIRLPRNAKVNVQLILHSGIGAIGMEEESESESEQGDSFLDQLERKYAKKSKREPSGPLSPPLDLTGQEREYFDKLPRTKKREYNEQMTSLSKIVKTCDVPASSRFSCF